MPSKAAPQRLIRDKATLYCFNCDHESPVDGDWVVHEYDECVDYWCPNCGTVIVSRRTEDSETVTESGREANCSPVN